MIQYDKFELSIIIPYYNTKKYTDELLACLNRQMKDCVQVILVDDGSDEVYHTDYEWCSVYRITNYNHGVSYARNLGLTKVRGRYIAFIDSDDLVADNYIDTILRKIEDEHFDYCYLSWKSFGGWNVSVKLNSIKDEFPDYNLCCWNRVYRFKCVSDIKFNPDKVISEDADYIRKAETFCKKKAFISDFMYYYRSNTPNSLTKRFAKGELDMDRVVFNYPKITKDMAWLLDEVKEVNEKGEAIVMCYENEIAELKNYAMVTKPTSIKGTELRGEYTDLFTKIGKPIRTNIAIWCGDIFAMGGMESFIYYFCQNMKDDYDITIVYRSINPQQRKRLEKIARIVQMNTKDIQCDLFISNRMLDKAPTNIRYHKKVQIIHCCRIDNRWHCGLDNDLIIPVSETVKNTYLDDIVGHATKVINDFVYIPEEKRRVLRLITASRLTHEKGGKRMIEFARLLQKDNIPFVWLVFSDDRLSEDIDGIVYMKPNLNVIDYIRDSDYLVQLSDSEAFCYSIVEALSVGTPVIATDLPVLSEIGFEHNKMGFKVGLDLKGINIPKIYESDLKFDFKHDNERIKKAWDSLIDVKSDVEPYVFNEKSVNIEALLDYNDIELGRLVKRGETITVSRERGELIAEKGFGRIV